MIRKFKAGLNLFATHKSPHPSPIEVVLKGFSVEAILIVVILPSSQQRITSLILKEDIKSSKSQKIL
jgi:hypothetical protein